MTDSKSKFHGLSMLRVEERKKEAAVAGPQAQAMQAYLKRYAAEGAADGEGGEKKKRKKKKVAGADGGAIKIIDQDLQGQAQGRRRAMSDDDDDENRPVIANEAEAQLLAKQAQKAKEFYKREEDGSGWASATIERPNRHDSPDASPPRRGGTARHDSPDASPPRRGGTRHDSPDASPPRRGGTTRHDSPDASPPRRGGTTRHDSPDASPPRRSGTARHDSPDASPPRRGGTARHDSPDASPPRRGGTTRHDSPDASPPRRGGTARHDSPDASPPRRGSAAGGAGGDRQGPRMADGTAAGLVSAEQLQRETARMKAEAAARRAAATGGNAETVYRDRTTGKAVTKDEFVSARAAVGRDGKKIKTKEEEKAEQHLEWRGGLAQRQAAQDIAARMVVEAAAPFARYEDDQDRDAMLKARTRFGDPMAGQTRQTHEEPVSVTDKYNADKLQQSGFMIPQGVPSHSWTKRGVAAPANRYNIRPGRHWDGVDRGTGFEKEMFKHQATVRHQEKEAREWAQADM